MDDTKKRAIMHFTELLLALAELHEDNNWEDFIGGYHTYAHMRTARKHLAASYGVPEVIRVEDLEVIA